MKFDKIKEILKNKRVQIMAGTVAGILILTIAGSILVHNKFNEANKTEDDKVVIVNKEKDSKDENKIEENSNNETIFNEETKTEDTKTESSSNTINENTLNSNTTSSDSSKNTNNDTTSKTSSSTSNSVSSTGSSSNNSTSNTTSTHTHNWVEVYKDVYHEEEGHYENVLVKEAWTETIPVYEEKEILICNDCGADLTNLSDEDFKSHMKSHMLSGGKGSWRTEYKQVQTGTNTINHDAVYEQKWVVDRASWTEKVLNGYKCSSCGETK